jgi:hypothetical protein
LTSEDDYACGEKSATSTHCHLDVKIHVFIFLSCIRMSRNV